MTAAPPKLWSARKTRWMLNLFPPLFFMRARVRHVDRDLMACSVDVKRSLLTRNLHGTTFGGALFSAADPIYSILLWQALARRGVDVEAWLESASIDYRAPARQTLRMEFRLEPELLDRAQDALQQEGRFSHSFDVEGVDPDGRVCVLVETRVFLRLRGRSRASRLRPGIQS